MDILDDNINKFERINRLGLDYTKLEFEKDQGFAMSLVGQFKTKGKLSDKQWVWVDKLLSMANPDMAPEPKKQEQIPDFFNVMALFDGAKVKYPRVTLNLGDGSSFDIARLGDKSKNPGHIKLFGPDAYYGRVAPDGTFFPSPEHNDDRLDALMIVMGSFAADPHRTIKNYGKQTGRCSICRRPLTDGQSIEAGVGPVCAATWQIPY